MYCGKFTIASKDVEGLYNLKELVFEVDCPMCELAHSDASISTKHLVLALLSACSDCTEDFSPHCKCMLCANSGQIYACFATIPLATLSARTHVSLPMCVYTEQWFCLVFSKKFNIMSAFLATNRSPYRKKSILAKVGFDAKRG